MAKRSAKAKAIFAKGFAKGKTKNGGGKGKSKDKVYTEFDKTKAAPP